MRLLIGFSFAFTLIVIAALGMQLSEHKSLDSTEVTLKVTPAPDPTPVTTPVSTTDAAPSNDDNVIDLDIVENNEEPPGTPEQEILYEQILTNVQDPFYVQDHTLGEVFEQMESLSPAQQERLQQTGMEMIARGELDLNDFKQPKFPRHLTIAEGAPLPSLEERAQYDQFSEKLRDPAYIQHKTDVQIALEIQSLPPALKQEIADKLNEMLKTGEVKPATLVGPEYAGYKEVKVFFD